MAIDDGAIEYMTFIRGIVVIGVQMYLKGIRPVFTNLESTDTDAILAPRMEALPLIDLDWLKMAITAIERLGPLCAVRSSARSDGTDGNGNDDDDDDDDDDGLAAEYHGHLLGWAREMQESSLGAYRALRRQYGWWMMQPHAWFARLIDMDDQVMVLLSAHWVALQLIMVFVLQVEQSVRAKTPAEQQRSEIDIGMGRWLRGLNPLVKPAYRAYNAFPMWMVRRVVDVGIADTFRYEIELDNDAMSLSLQKHSRYHLPSWYLQLMVRRI